jgi:RNA polymerase sigma-70 factor (ECF subfamily)
MLMRHAANTTTNGLFCLGQGLRYNQARTYLKRESRSRVVFDDDLVTAVAQDALAEPEESGLELKWLDFCLERLLPSQQALIRARYFRRESIEHLAAALRRTPISVYVQIHRIRRLLGACVESRRRHAEEGVGT